ncbi:hypothetical protein P692DRAFT_20876608 [Suillus brevipes Sb2]|nr:hypothetical protein P692DRAFT_20876608 [Suillus brevipes Sb2]
MDRTSAKHLFYSAPSGTWFGHGLDRFLNTQFRLLRLGDYWTFTPSHSLHNVTPMQHRNIHVPQAPKARLFPRLMQHSHATLASFIIHFAPLLDTAFAHFRFISANVPALRTPTHHHHTTLSRPYGALRLRLTPAPYACAFPAPSLRQSRLITDASDTLALHSSRITYPHHDFACPPHNYAHTPRPNYAWYNTVNLNASQLAMYNQADFAVYGTF